MFIKVNYLLFVVDNFSQSQIIGFQFSFTFNDAKIV